MYQIVVVLLELDGPLLAVQLEAGRALGGGGGLGGRGR
jgi:hypothetical protein